MTDHDPLADPTALEPDRLTVIATDLTAIAADLNAEHAACVRALSNALGHAVRAGELLIEAKALVRHGEWLPWLATNFAASERTAQNYMRLAAAYPELVAKSAPATDLTMRQALALLAAPTLPPDPAPGPDYEKLVAELRAYRAEERHVYELMERLCSDHGLTEEQVADEVGFDVEEVQLYREAHRTGRTYDELWADRHPPNPIRAALLDGYSRAELRALLDDD